MINMAAQHAAGDFGEQIELGLVRRAVVAEHDRPTPAVAKVEMFDRPDCQRRPEPRVFLRFI
jgi:hypothetical protein